MATYIYPTQDWLEECAKLYPLIPKFEKALQKLSMHICFRIEAEPDWGIMKNLFMSAVLDEGKLKELTLCTEEYAKKGAEFIMTATPLMWKSIIVKEKMFLTAFITGKIKLLKGSPAGSIKLAPYAPVMVDILAQVDLKFPDELLSDELAEFKDSFEVYRGKTGV